MGVRQVDNMAPVLFLFLITAFTKTLEIVWKERDIPILCVMTTVNEHIAEGKICSHTPAMFKSKKLTAYEILQCLYVDDGAFPFGTREDLQRGIELIFHHFARFGLEIHIGRGALESKTECVFPPPLSSSSAWRRPTSRHAQSNKRSGEHNEHTPWYVLWRKKGKAPGLNGIPPEALKAMDNVSQGTVHRHVCDFFEGEVDHERWHQSQCIPVPKRLSEVT